MSGGSGEPKNITWWKSNPNDTYVMKAKVPNEGNALIFGYVIFHLIITIDSIRYGYHMLRSIVVWMKKGRFTAKLGSNVIDGTSNVASEDACWNLVRSDFYSQVFLQGCNTGYARKKSY